MPRAYAKLKGVGGRLFADPHPSPDETSFQVDNTSSQYYQSPYYRLHQNDLQPVPKPRTPQPRMDLGAVLSADILGAIQAVVSIVGLYTNVLEGPGVISSQSGKYPILDESQLDFLKAELQRLAPARKAFQRAVIVACHHPPASVDSNHGGSTGLAADIDSAAQAAGFWPDAVLSGHAHLYQRFTRSVDGREIPYVVAGSGGFAATAPIGGLPTAPVTVGEYTLVAPPIVDFGYLLVGVDMSGPTPLLTIDFHDRTNAKVDDGITLDLAAGKIR